jgi:hypothetical protein
MAIRPKFEEIEMKDKQKEIEEVIFKGGRVIQDSEKEKEKWTMISMRIPVYLLEKLEAKKKEKLGMTRTACILQAIQKFIED